MPRNHYIISEGYIYKIKDGQFYDMLQKALELKDGEQLYLEEYGKCVGKYHNLDYFQKEDCQRLLRTTWDIDNLSDED